MLKQADATEVRSLEELCDSLLTFQDLGRWQGRNIAVIGGLADGGDGISVSASDCRSDSGLNMPPLSSRTREELTALLGEVASILCHPVDVSQAQRRDDSVLFTAIELVVEDPMVEIVLIQEDVDILLAYSCLTQVERVNDFFIDLRRKQGKPVAIVLPPGSAEPKRLSLEQRLLGASVPVFPTMERAAKAIARIGRYYDAR